MTKQATVAAILALTAVVGGGNGATRGPAKMTVNYGRPFETPTRQALIPLPPGAIEPTGWLRDWAETVRDGYTGHMEDVGQEFKQAWAADYKMTGDRLSFWDRGAWPYEGGAYWFGGMLKLGYALHDQALIAKAKARFDVVVANRSAHGILFMWWLDRNKPADMEAATKHIPDGEAQGWPMWANGLFGRSMVGYYSATADPAVLQTLESAYAGATCWTRKGWPAVNLWPALETYTLTGNKDIAKTLSDFCKANPVERPDRNASLYNSGCNRLPDETVAAYFQRDHGVHFAEAVNAWVAAYLWTGNRKYLDVPARWYAVMERGDQGMQPTGVPVSDENSGPTGSFRGTETCTVAAFTWCQISLLRATGQGLFGDRIERAVYNAGPAVANRDYTQHVYCQSPNRVRPDLPGPGPFLYRRAHWPFCCVASLNRILPNFLVHMWMATYDNGLAAVAYGPCRVTAKVADGVQVELDCRTDYPFDDGVEIGVKPATAAKFPLSFRVPGWCSGAQIAVNGKAQRAKPGRNGFVRIVRVWKSGDSVHLGFPMTPKVKFGHDNDAKDTPYATVSYGPLLFALPIPDTKDANTPDPSAKSNYALDEPGAIIVRRGPMPAKWNWQLDCPLTLEARAVAFDWQAIPRKTTPVGNSSATAASPFGRADILTIMPSGPVPSGKSESIRLVPYGCTKFRVSMFPVTERAYRLSPAK